MGLRGYIPDNDYWMRNFGGRLMQADWELPPLDIHGKSKKLGDFVGWSLQAPIVSERARDVLEPIVGDAVQFVRFHELRGKPYYGINVLRVERSYLDVERSKCNPRKNGEIAVCLQYVFRDDLPDELPAIFKIHPESSVFVTRRFAEAVVEHKLTGFCLQDPGKNALTLISKGQPLNAYPGLL
jgi:hypothetical protein